MGSAGRRCFIHIGFQKTGTTYLQSVFWQSKEQLRAQGLEMLTDSFRDTSHLMLAVRGLLVEGVHPPRAFTVLDRMQKQAAASTADRVLISQETLAPATSEEIRGLLDRLPDHEVHVVVTARDIARQVPSAWQERVKTRSTDSYETFLHDVVHRGPAAEQFWRVHDLPNVLGRWSQLVPADRVHVVTVPQRGASPGQLLERFCRLLDVDPADLERETARTNTSIGLVQAELMRRVNVALGDRLPTPQDGYGAHGKRFLGEDVLASQRAVPPRLPAGMAAWCEETAGKWRGVITEQGYDVVGDLEDLHPLASTYAEEPQEVADGDLVTAAAEAIATMLDRRHQERDELQGLRRTLREQEAELRRLRKQVRRTQEAPPAPTLLGRARGAAARAVLGRR